MILVLRSHLKLFHYQNEVDISLFYNTKNKKRKKRRESEERKDQKTEISSRKEKMLNNEKKNK
jgi:hypothetical protein